MFQPIRKRFDRRTWCPGDFLGHWRLLGISAVLLFSILYFLSAQMALGLEMKHGIKVTLADCLVLADSKCGGVMGIKGMAVLPLYLWLLLAVTARENSAAYALARGSRRAVWKNLAKKNFCSALIFSVTAWGMICAAGSIGNPVDCNWNQQSSAYWAAAGEVLDRQISVWSVGAAYWMVTFLMLLLSGYLFLICMWGFSQPAIGWILCLGLCFAEESGRMSISILYGRFTISFDQWKQVFPWGRMMVEAGAAAVLLHVLGAVLGRRKEYYGK